MWAGRSWCRWTDTTDLFRIVLLHFLLLPAMHFFFPHSGIFFQTDSLPIPASGQNGTVPPSMPQEHLQAKCQTARHHYTMGSHPLPIRPPHHHALSDTHEPPMIPYYVHIISPEAPDTLAGYSLLPGKYPLHILSPSPDNSTQYHAHLSHFHHVPGCHGSV